MELETFLHQLHFDTEKVSPPDWQVDWEDAPLPYKLYRGLPEVPLTADVPLRLERREEHLKPVIEELGHFLWYVYGLTQYSQLPFYEGKAQSIRRFVPLEGDCTLMNYTYI